MLNGTRRVCAVLGIIAGGISCGAADLVVKPPVAKACASTGLQRCDELSDAVVAYVEGDQASAEPKLRAVASANSPEAIRVFAGVLRPLVSLLGDETETSIEAALAILEGPEEEPTSVGERLLTKLKTASATSKAGALAD